MYIHTYISLPPSSLSPSPSLFLYAHTNANTYVFKFSNCNLTILVFPSSRRHFFHYLRFNLQDGIIKYNIWKYFYFSLICPNSCLDYKSLLIYFLPAALHLPWAFWLLTFSRISPWASWLLEPTFQDFFSHQNWSPMLSERIIVAKMLCDQLHC